MRHVSNCLALLFLVGLTTVDARADELQSPDSLASEVTIHRDLWGVPHVYGSTDAAVAFGSGYSQCEDHFWQFEETYLKCIGRYAEVVGEPGLQSDLENALFEIVETSISGYPNLPEYVQDICAGFAGGYNHYLKKHPEVKPRLLTKMEPHHVLMYDRFMMLGRLTGAAHAPMGKLQPLAAEMKASLGSNQWAVAPSKTKNGNAMLFINPHQPWYGSGMFTEMHVRSDEGWNFSGTMFPGSPFPTAGFNDRLGWAYTVNSADISDVYRLQFDHPSDPLQYRYGDGYKTAQQWTASIKVKTDAGMEAREFTFRKTHYGPVISKPGDKEYLAVRVPRLYDGSRIIQSLAQTKAKDFNEWYAAVSQQRLQTFNTMYADADGNIFYLYNGVMAERDPAQDWTQPVDGSDPKNEWGPFHPVEELPQVLNPISGFMQNCNSTPFTTTDDGNPSMKDFPPYMVEDKYDDKRRAKVARYLLRRSNNITFEQFQDFAYDTTLYWAMTEIPAYKRQLQRLQQTNPELVKDVQPYFDHFNDWDYKCTIDSTQATLVVQWYEVLYGRGYPVETLKPEFVADIPARFAALVTAAEQLTELYGDWKVPYGDIHRLQRHAPYGSAAEVPFDDRQPSLPLAGVRGPLGVAFTVYHSPPTELPHRKKQYAATGASYMACYEFGEKVNAVSYLHYGQSHDPNSPHFFDQAKLLSERKFKPAWFHWEDVLAHTEKAYHPGEE